MNPENQNVEQSTPPQIPTSPMVAAPVEVKSPLADITPVPTPKKKVSVIGIVFVVVFLFLLIGGGGVSAALVAYDKVSLPSLEMQTAIRNVVLSLPFAPKTSAYVIEKTAMATTNLVSGSLDASVSISSSSLLSVAGSNNLDISVKGSFDKTDSSNIKSDFTLKAGNLFAADVKATDKKIYVKVNTFPTKLITPFIPISEEMLTSEFSHWIVWESNTLDTEARTLIEQNSQTQSKTPAEALTSVLKNKTLMSKIALTTETLDGMSVYKLHPTVDAEFVKAYVSEFGSDFDKQNLDAGKWLESLNDFNLDMYIEKSSYHVVKINVSFGSKQNSSLLSPVISMVPGVSSEDIKVAAVLKLTDYNKPLTVAVPTDTKSWQDVYADIAQVMMSSESATLMNPQNQFETARDTQRRTDLYGITNAIYQYAADNNGNLPATTKAAFPTKEVCIGTATNCFDLSKAGKAGSFIVPTYIASVPKDPKNGTDANTQYFIYMDENGRLHARASSELEPKTPITIVR